MSGQFSRSVWLGIAAIVVALAAVYHSAASFPFVWTDHAEIEEKTLVPTDLDELGRMLSSAKGTAKPQAREAYLKDRPKGAYAYYRPTKALTYGLDWVTGGGQPWSFHLTNLLLHALVCVGLLLICRNLFGDSLPYLPECVAVLHAIMPLHVEAVCWISARSDVLWGLFTLSGILLLMRARKSQSGLKRQLYVGATGILVLLAAGSKESGLAMAGILAAFSLIVPDPAGTSRFRRMLKECWAGIAAAILYLVLRLTVIGDVQLGSMAAREGLNLWTILDVFGRNLIQSFLPVGLRLADTIEVVSGPTLLGLLGPLLMAAWLIAGYRLRRASPLILFCAIGWLLAIAPVSQVFPLLHPRGERYLYVPALFAEVTMLWILWNLVRSAPKTVIRWAVILSGAVVLASLALLSYSRALPWADERLLFSTALLEEPECAECWNNLAFAEAVRGNYRKAEIASLRGLAIDRGRYRGARDGFSLRFILIRSLLLQGKGHLATSWIWQLVRKGGPQPANLKLLLEALGQAAASGRFHPGLLFYGN